MSTEPPILDYAMPGHLRQLRISLTPEELVIVDSGGKVWFIVLSFVMALFWAGFPLAVALPVFGPGLFLLGVGVFCAIPAVFFFLMGIDDIVKRVFRATITVRAHEIRIVSYSWLGRREVVEPVTSVRNVQIAIGSPTVHAWNSVVIWFDRRARLSMLRCRDKRELAYAVSLLRRCVAGSKQVATLSGQQTTS